MELEFERRYFSSGPAILRLNTNAARAIGSSKSTRDNLPIEERKAIDALKKAQRDNIIQIKRADKGGGVVLVNTADYIAEMESQLNAKFKDGNQELPYYIRSSEKDLKIQQKEITKLIEVGAKKGYISESDAKAMAPSGHPGRLYGQPKVHKPIQPGKKIPPHRPIISNSGAKFVKSAN